MPEYFGVPWVRVHCFEQGRESVGRHEVVARQTGAVARDVRLGLDAPGAHNLAQPFEPFAIGRRQVRRERVQQCLGVTIAAPFHRNVDDFHEGG